MFRKILKDEAENIGISLSDDQLRKFEKYKDMILEWNEKINLTAITEVNEIISKHFVDSLSICKYINEGDSVIDIGTGAGFPGIPLKIYFEDKIDLTLVDSLNKRVIFLQEVIKEIEMTNVKAIHFRAEDLSKKAEHREIYNKVVSRAVAAMPILCEYTIPLVKIQGKVICMKGPNFEEELKESTKEIENMGCSVEKIDKIELKSGDRNIILITKHTTTPNKYPRNISKIKSKK